MSLGSKMNNLDALGSYHSWKDKEHVVSALTFMRRPASHWAATYNAKIIAGEEIFQDQLLIRQAGLSLRPNSRLAG
jgi:hypothetical protein